MSSAPGTSRKPEAGGDAPGSAQCILIKVADARLGATEEFKTVEGETAVHSSRARTLVDAAYDWSRLNTLPRAYEWIRNELAAKRVSRSELVKVTLRYGNTGTIRRIGALLEREGVEEESLRRLDRALKRTTSLIPWIPTRPKRGTVNRRWAVVLNEQT